MPNIHFLAKLFPPILSEYKPFVLLDSATYLLLLEQCFRRILRLKDPLHTSFSLYAAIPFLQAVSMPRYRSRCQFQVFRSLTCGQFLCASINEMQQKHLRRWTHFFRGFPFGIAPLLQIHCHKGQINLPSFYNKRNFLTKQIFFLPKTKFF